MSTSLIEVQQYMSLYALSTFYILGTIGNFLLICVCLQRNHRRNSCSLYLLSASIVNFILIQCILPLAIYSANHPDPLNISLIWCKIRSYLFNALLMLYRWYKMAACIDRAAICNRHARIRAFANIRIAYRVVLIITIVWLLIPIHLAIYFRIESDRCAPEQGIYAKFFSAYAIVISGWSPPIVMIIFGTIAYVNLKKIRARVLPIDLPNGTVRRPRDGTRIGKRDRQLLISLICEVILYVLTNLLFSVNTTYLAITASERKTMERLGIESFISYFASPFLIIINNCAPFYLYFLVSSKFRRDVFKFFIICCRCQRCIPNPNNHSITIQRIHVKNHRHTNIPLSQ